MEQNQIRLVPSDEIAPQAPQPAGTVHAPAGSPPRFYRRHAEDARKGNTRRARKAKARIFRAILKARGR